MSEQKTAVPTDVKESNFYAKYKGVFYGVLRWPQLDDLWLKVKESEKDWYIYAVGEQPPEKEVGKASLANFIVEIDRLLRREHDEDYCGIVYTDHIQEPTYIKIFDPNNVGTSCGTAKTSPLPGWILSTTQPIDLPAALLQASLTQPNNRKRWWKKVFS